LFHFFKDSSMSQLPAETVEIKKRFGPTLAYASGSRLDTGVEPDRLVKTHCCFCGQQCGIQLKVSGNEVIGFEPWYSFPFNKGKLCPKGVKRYLQGAHPDRLTKALQCDPSAEAGFSSIAYETAIGRVGVEIERIQSQYGKDAFAVLSGASLTTEKAYLIGKFAHMCLRTANIDYNGRLCMVSAAAGNKKAFGVDRAANPWSDIIGTDVVWISGANIGECAPINTSYVWQARPTGAEIYMGDPQSTPRAKNCDVVEAVEAGSNEAEFKEM
jgi:assimilatory nitrate reductase catalytic subunit